MIERSRTAPDRDKGTFTDRAVWLETTIGGAGRLTGDLTGTAAAAVAVVLAALSAEGGAEDTRTLPQRQHDALAEACRQLSRSRADSGMAFGLCQTIAFRRIQPFSCKANATRHGRPSKFFAGTPAAPCAQMRPKVGVQAGGRPPARGVRIAQVQSAGAVAGQDAAGLGERRPQRADIGGRAGFAAVLASHAIVTFAPVRRAGHDAIS